MDVQTQTILLVDDDASNIDLLVALLEDKYDLFVALNGQDALNFASKHTPDLILLDIMMPGMDGFEVCRRLKENDATSKIPVIFLTALTTGEDVAHGFLCGGVDYITKPIETEELYARITTHLSLSRYQKDLETMVVEKTAEASQKAKELLRTLQHDANTGLANALVLREHIKKYQEGYLLFLDIDHFNNFNKLYGYLTSDKILKETATILQMLLEENMKLYKADSDRYVILASGYRKEEIEAFCKKVLAYLDVTEVEVDDCLVSLSFSIGVAAISMGFETMIQGEYALEVAKMRGGRTSYVYDGSSGSIANVQDSVEWMRQTKQFILDDRIIPFFQPIVDVKTGKIYKFEALARVIDGQKVISPVKFLGAAQRLGLLSSITKAIISKTFEAFAHKNICFSINISERDLMEDYLLEYLNAKGELHGIKPVQVTLEMLEDITLSHNNEAISEKLEAIKKAGYRIAIDDFGSENSNFSRILSFKSDYIKIDGIFIHEIDTSPEKQKILEAIVLLAKKLDIKTVAEFVSDEAIFNKIREIGVDYAQGYFLGKPEQNVW